MPGMDDVDDGEISYMALQKGTPVQSSAGNTFGVVEHVLQVPSLDLFDGIVVRSHHALHFVDRDQITRITRTAVHCDLSDAEAEALPKPSAPPVEHVGGLGDDGTSLTARLGRLFRRPHWVEDDK